MRKLLAVPSGIIRGGLAVLGLHTTVSLDYNGGSQCQSGCIQEAYYALAPNSACLR